MIDRAYQFVEKTVARPDLPCAEDAKDFSDKDWHRAVHIASACLVQGFFFSRLKSAGLAGRLPTDAREYLEGLLFFSQDRELRAAAQLREIDEALGRSALGAVALKGAGLVLSGLYPEPGCRVFGDIDLLAQPGRVNEVLDVLEALGYRSEFNLPRPVEAWCVSHHLPPLTKPGELFGIELHIEPMHRKLLHPCPFDQKYAWEHRKPINGCSSLFVLKPSLGLFHAFFHDQISDRGALAPRIGLKALMDASVLSVHSSSHPELKDLSQAGKCLAQWCRFESLRADYGWDVEQHQDLGWAAHLYLFSISNFDRLAWLFFCLHALSFSSEYLLNAIGPRGNRRIMAEANPTMRHNIYSPLSAKLFSGYYWRDFAKRIRR